MGESSEDRVRSGAFRVDRARALERLSGYRFQDSAGFLRSWLRAAVASGATGVSVERSRSGLELRFDGRPFEPEVLESPYAAIFGDEDAERYPSRQLAIGLLGALGTGGLVQICSGSATKRRKLSVSELDGEQVESAADGGTGTILRVRWEGMRGWTLPYWLLSAAREAAGLYPIPLWLDGAPAQRDSAGGIALPRLSLEDAGLRGWVRPALRAEFGAAKDPSCVVHLYSRGVLVGVQRRPASQPLVAHVDDDRLRLDASQSSVVQDDALERVFVEVQRAAAGLTGEALRSLPAEPWDAPAPVVLWLRELADDKLGPIDEDESDPELAALWRAPLYRGSCGEPLSLQDAWREGRADPGLPSTDALWERGYPPPARPVWYLPGGSLLPRRLELRINRAYGNALLEKAHDSSWSRVGRALGLVASGVQLGLSAVFLLVSLIYSLFVVGLVFVPFAAGLTWFSIQVCRWAAGLPYRPGRYGLRLAVLGALEAAVALIPGISLWWLAHPVLILAAGACGWMADRELRARVTRSS